MNVKPCVERVKYRKENIQGKWIKFADVEEANSPNIQTISLPKLKKHFPHDSN